MILTDCDLKVVVMYQALQSISLPLCIVNSLIVLYRVRIGGLTLRVVIASPTKAFFHITSTYILFSCPHALFIAAIIVLVINIHQHKIYTEWNTQNPSQLQ